MGITQGLSQVCTKPTVMRYTMVVRHCYSLISKVFTAWDCCRGLSSNSRWGTLLWEELNSTAAHRMSGGINWLKDQSFWSSSDCDCHGDGTRRASHSSWEAIHRRLRPVVPHTHVLVCRNVHSPNVDTRVDVETRCRHTCWPEVCWQRTTSGASLILQILTLGRGMVQLCIKGAVIVWVMVPMDPCNPYGMSWEREREDGYEDDEYASLGKRHWSAGVICSHHYIIWHSLGHHV